MEPLASESVSSGWESQKEELSKSLNLEPRNPQLSRHRHWSTGTERESSTSSSGNSLEDLREKLEKSDYVVVARKHLGVFNPRIRHESLERAKRRSNSEGDDLFTSTKALRDSFKTVSFAQKAKLIHLGSYERRGSAPTIQQPSSLLSSPATSNPNLLNSGSYFSESEASNRKQGKLRGILKSRSASGSETSLHGASSREQLATVVNTHRKIVSSKSNGDSGSNSPANCSRRNSNSSSRKNSNSDKDDDEKLFLVKTITKKLGKSLPDIGTGTAGPVSGAAGTSDKFSKSYGGESTCANAGPSEEPPAELRRSRYGMSKPTTSLLTARRKISNCPEEDESEALRKESVIKVVRKKKKSRDEQRERRLSRKEEHQQQQALAAMALVNEQKSSGIINPPENTVNPENKHETPETENKLQMNGHGTNDGELIVQNKKSTSGIESSRSDEELGLGRLLLSEHNVSTEDTNTENVPPVKEIEEVPQKLDAMQNETVELPIISVENSCPEINNYTLNYTQRQDQGYDDGFDDDEVNDKISDIDTSFSQSFSTTNYDFSLRRQSDSSFTESFKHLQPFNFDLEPIKEGKRERLYKVLVVGELGTGKTSVIKRYVHQFFSQHYRATIGVDFALKVLRWDPETVVRLQLWDIAGQERFGSMTRVYYKEAVGAFVVFDVTRAATLEAVPKWKADLDSKVVLPDGRPIPTVLIANKCDQPKEGIAANKEKMNEFCQQQGFTSWFETSAKDNTNIDEAANFLVSKILEIDRWSQEPVNSDPEKVALDSNGKHRVGTSKNNCSC